MKRRLARETGSQSRETFGMLSRANPVVHQDGPKAETGYSIPQIAQPCKQTLNYGPSQVLIMACRLIDTESRGPVYVVDEVDSFPAHPPELSVTKNLLTDPTH
jgi:hypothetical protein